jgi:hypothetical protein
MSVGRLLSEQTRAHARRQPGPKTPVEYSTAAGANQARERTTKHAGMAWNEWMDAYYLKLTDNKGGVVHRKPNTYRAGVNALNPAEYLC